METEIVHPRDCDIGVQRGLADQRVVRAAVELHHDALRFDFDQPARFDELAVDLFGLGLLETTQATGQPAVATVR